MTPSTLDTPPSSPAANPRVTLLLAFCLGALALWCIPDFVAWLCGTGVVTL